LLALSGAVVWRMPVSATQAREPVVIYVPSGLLHQGNYRLIVRGHAKAGENTVELQNYWFTLSGAG
jgi:hypothetical protein